MLPLEIHTLGGMISMAQVSDKDNINKEIEEAEEYLKKLEESI